MQQQGGSHYGAPPPPPPPPPPQQQQQPPQPLAPPSKAEVVPPINSRPPQPLDFDELATTVSASLPEEADRGGGGIVPGNRWPRHETLALIRIRSDMDTTFREATLKGPLWEEVSRKLAEQGITRSSKKCKEKFENVHKYYKRTKEGRAGRQDGKNYRFSSELEALQHNHHHQQHNNHHNPMNPALMNNVTAAITANPIHHPNPITTIHPPLPPPLSNEQPSPPPPFSSLLGSSSDPSDSDTDSDGERRGKHRRRCKRRTMALFAEMVRKVMEQQETMQQRFLDVIEKREQDRMAREEAWRRQEAARASREHELAAQDRSLAASRDAAIISFLQKISDHSFRPTIQTDRSLDQQTKVVISAPPRQQEGFLPADGGGGDPTSSRWPKTEVLALIDLRTGLDARYNDNGPKGPLWQEISAGMRELGYKRSAKRCKEKWENINKYFKKVKESNKKRPEDAKTCPYFHQLDAIYRSRSLAGNHPPRLPAAPPPRSVDPPALPPPPPPPTSSATNLFSPPKANGEPPSSASNKVEETVMGGGDREGSKQSDVQDSASVSGHEDDYYDDEDEEDEEEDEDEDEKMAYKIEFQRPSINGGGGGSGGAGSGVSPSSNASGVNPPASAPTATGSFVAMVQ